MRFRATVLLGGKTATGFEVPDEVVEALGSGRRPAVRVTVGGHTYRSTVAVLDGRHLLPLSAENREAAGLSAGDEVDVEVELDTEPRTIMVPADLAAELEKCAEAKAFYESLSYSKQRRLVEPIGQAKTDETRQRRIAKVITTLHEHGI